MENNDLFVAFCLNLWMSRLVAAGVLPESFKLQNKAPIKKRTSFLQSSIARL